MGTPFGRYELLKRIAAGGMGEVYLARQAGLEGFEKLLVVKVLLPNLAEDREFTEMFLDEARIAARLDHPNIGQIYDMGEVDGSYYIAMEYIRGDDVVRLWKQARHQNRSIPAALAVRIAADAAAGLDYAHKAVGIDNEPLHLIHRDVSPQNILVTFDGGVKLIDFGVAKAAGRVSHTSAGTIKGKFAYMSPEQISGGDIDHRSDIFALGVVLFEMLTARRLFKRENEVQTIQAVSECEIPPPSEVEPSIDPMLEGILLKALAKDRDDRYEDAQAFRMALEEWMLEKRQPGTAAHLAAFMKELYAERLAEERARGKPYDDSDGTPSQLFRRPGMGHEHSGTSNSFPNVTTRSRISVKGGSVKVAVPQQAAAAGPEAESDIVSAVIVPESRSNKGLIAAIVVLAVVMAGVGVAFLMRPSSPAQVPAAVGIAGGTLNLLTTPAGADVFIDGEKIDERTPLQGYPLPRKDRVKVEIRREGFLPVVKTVGGAGIQNLDLTLEPDPAAAQTPDKGAGPVETPPAAPKNIVLRIESTPSGAMAYSRGAFLGKTPLELERRPSDALLEIQLELAGYRTLTTEVSQKESGTMALDLVPLPPTPEPPTAAPVKKRQPRTPPKQNQNKAPQAGDLDDIAMDR